MINLDVDELLGRYPILNVDWSVVRGKNCLIEVISKIVRSKSTEDNGDISHLQDFAKDARGIYIGVNWYFSRGLSHLLKTNVVANSDPWRRPFPNYRSGLKSDGNMEIKTVTTGGVHIMDIASVNVTTVSGHRVYCVDVYV